MASHVSILRRSEAQERKGEGKRKGRERKEREEKKRERGGEEGGREKIKSFQRLELVRPRSQYIL